MCFFRGDSREPDGPSGVFQTGFTPTNHAKNQSKEVEQWQQAAIRDNTGQTSDAFYPDVVCVSSRMESAAMFPLSDKNKDECYVYIIKLPSEGKLPMEHVSGKDNRRLNDAGVVFFDLHQLQTSEAKSLMGDDPEINSGFVGIGLFGYETFANYIPKEFIVCALKCERKMVEQSKQEAFANLGTTKRMFDLDDNSGELRYMVPPEREFTPVEILVNPNCGLSQQEIDAEVEHYRSLLNQPLRTTPVEYGLGGKTLPNPVRLPLGELKFLETLSKKVSGKVIGIPFASQIPNNIDNLKKLLIELEEIKSRYNESYQLLGSSESTDQEEGRKYCIKFISQLQEEVRISIKKNEEALAKKENDIVQPPAPKKSPYIPQQMSTGGPPPRRPPPRPGRKPPPSSPVSS